MSIYINLYNNKSKNYMVNKDIEQLYMFSSCKFKNATSFNNPVIQLQITDKKYIHNINYASISYDKGVTNKYYYVTDIVTYTNDIYEMTLSIDTLKTFYNDYKDSICFCSRNQYSYNKFITDNRYPLSSVNDVVEYYVSNGEKVNVNLNSSSYNQYNIVLCTYDSVVYNTASYAVTPSLMLPTTYPTNTGLNMNMLTYVLDRDIARDVLKVFTDNEDKATFVASMVIYPFNLPRFLDTTVPIYVGKTHLTKEDGSEIRAYDLNANSNAYLVVGDFSISGYYGNYLDYSPYTTYQIYLPYAQWVTLNATDILDKRLLVIYTLNYATGSTLIQILNDTDNKYIYSTTANLGVNYPINTTNLKEIKNNTFSNNLNMLLGLTASGLSAIGGVSSGNPIATVGGVLSGAKTLGTYITNERGMYDKAQCTVSDGNLAVYTPQSIRVKITRPKALDVNIDAYLEQNGRPLNEFKKISDIHGYTELINVHIDKLSSGTDYEKSQLEQDLTNGVILPE